MISKPCGGYAETNFDVYPQNEESRCSCQTVLTYTTIQATCISFVPDYYHHRQCRSAIIIKRNLVLCVVVLSPSSSLVMSTTSLPVRRRIIKEVLVRVTSFQ